MQAREGKMHLESLLWGQCRQSNATPVHPVGLVGSETRTKRTQFSFDPTMGWGRGGVHSSLKGSILFQKKSYLILEGDSKIKTFLHKKKSFNKKRIPYMTPSSMFYSLFDIFITFIS
jgi:hypothetical protein